MKIPMNWLGRYVELGGVSPEEIQEQLTMRGLEVSSVQTLHEDIQNVAVGRIVEMKRHQDSDHLWICQVDAGRDDVMQIVTGAQNIQTGNLVPVALHGALLPGGVKIKKGKLRGEVSQGMLCSGAELLLKESDYPGAETDGILILQDGATVGQDVKELLGLGGVVLEVEPTPNRPDCLSVYGVARELASVLGHELNAIGVSLKENAPGAMTDHVRIDVLDTDICPRYMARTVKNIRIAPSPAWMRQCLQQAGLRAINNIVDITNFVMLELGQPLHAFDLACVKNEHIVVRRARAGESIVTLDGKTRALDENMLLICDIDQPVGIAGVMGGENSEITERTQTVLFESANFNGANIRKTAKALGMSTDASAKFSKGVDLETTAVALARACALVEELGAGEVERGAIDLCHADLSRKEFAVRVARVNALLGLTIGASEMADILNGLYLEAKTDESGENLLVTIPRFRDDIEGEADIAEEVARVLGHDKITPSLMKGDMMRGKLTNKQKQLDKTRALLCGMGSFEAVTYAFTGHVAYDKLLLDEDHPLRKDSVSILNPFGEDASLMRTTAAVGMLQVLATNASRKIPAARFFEITNVHRKQRAEKLPAEKRMLCIGLYGGSEDFYTLKGIIDTLFSMLDAAPWACVAGGEVFYHPGRKAKILFGKEEAGQFGELHPDVTRNFDIPMRAYLAEINLDALLEKCALQEKRYMPLPRYPAVSRDLSLVVPSETEAGAMMDVMKRSGGKLLETAALFDVYEGKNIQEGYKSLAFSLQFRAEDRTLIDDEVAGVMKKVLDNLHKSFGAEIRQ